jgi:Flp pilus assembly protein TadD
VLGCDAYAAAFRHDTAVRRMSSRIAAERLVEDGRAAAEAGDVVTAEHAYRSAAELEPKSSVPHYNLGLLCKYQGRWQESLTFNRRASELAPDDQAGWWNRRIAATALSEWAEARACWTTCGIPDPGGSDPPDYRFGRPPRR